jgi:transposase
MRRAPARWDREFAAACRAATGGNPFLLGELRAAVVGALSSDVPSVYACYRFTAKVRVYGDMLTGCIDRVTAGLSAQLPEYGRKATKWRCPTGECAPASVWIKAERIFLMIPRDTPRFAALYRRRSAVEREFGRLKHEWPLAPLRVRGLDRVRLHADLTILAKLACALRRARAVPLAA